MNAGFDAAWWVAGFLLGLATIAVPLAVLAAVGWWAWNGPAARAGLRIRAWRFVHGPSRRR